MFSTDLDVDAILFGDFHGVEHLINEPQLFVCQEQVEDRELQVHFDFDDECSDSDEDSDDDSDGISLFGEGSTMHAHRAPRRNSNTSCDKHVPHVWNPTNEEVELMCDAFRKLTTAMWFHVDLKHSEKHRWSNKCLQMTVLQLCHGHARQHARRLFNKRCANDCVSGSCSVTSVDDVHAVL